MNIKITNAVIESLMIEAAISGNKEREELCERALRGDRKARKQLSDAWDRAQTSTAKES